VANEEMAEILISEWLKKWTPKFARRSAQKWSRIENLDRALIETIKYGGKIIKLPDANMKAKGNHNPTICAAALHNIFAAMKGLRIFERFGFDLPKSKAEAIPARVTNEYQ
jgi:hypothetical protein